MWKSTKLILSYMEYTHAVQARSPNHFFRVNVPAIPKKRKKGGKKNNKNIKNTTKNTKHPNTGASQPKAQPENWAAFCPLTRSKH